MSLAKLMAAQAAAKAAKESPNAPTIAHAPVVAAEAESEPGSSDNGNVLSVDDKPAPTQGGLAFLKGASKSAAVEAKPAAAVPTQPSSGGTVARGGLAFLKGKPAADTSNPASVASPSPSPVVAPKATPYQAKLSSDLESLMEHDAPAHRSRFADEIPATGPARELPEGLEAAGKAFIDSLDSIYRIVHEPDLLGGVVKSIMIELQNHPEYRKLIAPSDVHAMVRGMRESMGLARIKKEESKSKRSGTAGKKKVQVDDLEVLAALEGMDFS